MEGDRAQGKKEARVSKRSVAIEKERGEEILGGGGSRAAEEEER